MENKETGLVEDIQKFIKKYPEEKKEICEMLQKIIEDMSKSINTLEGSNILFIKYNKNSYEVNKIEGKETITLGSFEELEEARVLIKKIREINTHITKSGTDYYRYFGEIIGF
ncbi:MAG: hypothetical protein ACRC0V_05140 [Fusobacteriaceae bacterium]